MGSLTRLVRRQRLGPSEGQLRIRLPPIPPTAYKLSNIGQRLTDEEPDVLHLPLEIVMKVFSSEGQYE